MCGTTSWSQSMLSKSKDLFHCSTEALKNHFITGINAVLKYWSIGPKSLDFFQYWGGVNTSILQYWLERLFMHRCRVLCAAAAVYTSDQALFLLTFAQNSPGQAKSISFFVKVLKSQISIRLNMWSTIRKSLLSRGSTACVGMDIFAGLGVMVVTAASAAEIGKFKEGGGKK